MSSKYGNAAVAGSAVVGAMEVSSSASSLSAASSSSTSGEARDFLSEYRAISSKLKKRFLRRPNVSEANEQFARLSKRLSAQDEPQYEALCHLAVARCEQSVGNHWAEVDALVSASRSFLRAESKVQANRGPSLESSITAAIHSYCHAIRILEEGGNASKAAGLCLELGDALISLDKVSKAQTFYQRAADLRANTIMEYAYAREKVSDCLLELGDYHGALLALTEIAHLVEAHAGSPPRSAYADLLARCEILRVLAILLLKPTGQNLSPCHTTVLEKYSWEVEDSTASEQAMHYLSEDIFVLIQSTVMAVQVKDFSALSELEDYLTPHIQPRATALLRRLVHDRQRHTSLVSA